MILGGEIREGGLKLHSQTCLHGYIESCRLCLHPQLSTAVVCMRRLSLKLGRRAMIPALNSCTVLTLRYTTPSATTSQAKQLQTYLLPYTNGSRGQPTTGVVFFLANTGSRYLHTEERNRAKHRDSREKSFSFDPLSTVSVSASTETTVSTEAMPRPPRRSLSM